MLGTIYKIWWWSSVDDDDDGDGFGEGRDGDMILLLI